MCVWTLVCIVVWAHRNNQNNFLKKYFSIVRKKYKKKRGGNRQKKPERMLRRALRMQSSNDAVRWLLIIASACYIVCSYMEAVSDTRISREQDDELHSLCQGGRASSSTKMQRMCMQVQRERATPIFIAAAQHMTSVVVSDVCNLLARASSHATYVAIPVIAVLIFVATKRGVGLQHPNSIVTNHIQLEEGAFERFIDGPGRTAALRRRAAPQLVLTN